MSVILPANDSGYSDRGPLNQVEEEYRQEVKRMRERQESQLKKMDEDHTENLRNQADHYDKNAADIRNAGNTALENQRKVSDNDLKMQKKSTYDRFGKQNTSEVEALRKQLEANQKGYDASRVHYQELSDAAEDHFNKRIDTVHSESQEKLTDSTERATRNAAEGYEKSIQLRKDAEIEAQNEKHDLFTKASRENVLARYRADKLSDKQVNELESGYAIQKAKTNEINENRALTQSQAADQKLKDQATQSRVILNEQTQELRDRIGKFADAEGAQPRLYAEGRSDGLREIEQDAAQRLQTAAGGYESEIKNLKNRTGQVEQYEARRRGEIIEEMSTRNNNLLRQQAAEAHQNLKDVTQSFSGKAAQAKMQASKEKQRLENAAEYQLDKAHQEFGEEIGDQARAYQDKMALNEKGSRTTISQLKAQKQEAETTTDIQRISPAGEEKIRNQLIAQFQGALKEDMDRNKRALDSTQESYSQKMRGALAEKDSEYGKIIRQSNSLAADQTSSLLNHITEVESLKNSAVNEQTLARNREADRMMRSFAFTLEKQRREMDDVLSTERQAASTKIDTLRQGFEFEQRMNHRAFAEQQNELIRGYDKRLADQKTDFAHVMDETKNGYDKKLRESERRQQTALEDQARAYEQRIVQMEATISERDRKSAAFHADEMDKMRRSHELSAKKKS